MNEVEDINKNMKQIVDNGIYSLTDLKNIKEEVYYAIQRIYIFQI